MSLGRTLLDKGQKQCDSIHEPQKPDPTPFVLVTRLLLPLHQITLLLSFPMTLPTNQTPQEPLGPTRCVHQVTPRATLQILHISEVKSMSPTGPLQLLTVLTPPTLIDPPAHICRDR